MGTLKPHMHLTSMIKYADDIISLIPVEDVSGIANRISDEINNVKSWCSSHGLQLNCDKTKVMIAATSKTQINLVPSIRKQNEVKILGITYTSDLKWDAHIDDIIKKASQRLYIFKNVEVFSSNSGIDKNLQCHDFKCN